MTYADAVIGALSEVGVRRLWGMPGGGSNSDLIQAAARADLPFSLAQTESASAFMATAQAELTGRPAACLATLGPGAAAMTNGVANAYLDRVPLVVLTDCRTADAAAVMQHQTLAHGEIFGSMVKWSGRPEPGSGRRALQAAMDAVTSPPPGPVHLDLTAEFTSAPVPPADVAPRAGAGPQTASGPSLPADVERLLREARRPALLLGLGARSPALAADLRALAGRLGIPVLVTYKAKGVVPDRDPWFAGVLTNGALEHDVLGRADAFLAVGLDPVELLPRHWEYQPPIIALNGWPMQQRQLPIRYEMVGDLPKSLAAVGACLSRSDWVAAEVCQLAESQRSRMRIGAEAGRLSPSRVVDLVADVYPTSRITVDAGAHMFPVMSLWPASEPGGVCISNGLATMGFALPAAIGAATIDRDRPVVAFTGDGGLLMCVAELLTATRERLPVRVVVFDDGALSLIQVKQEQRGYAPRGVLMQGTDWAAVGRGFGATVRVASDDAGFADALDETAADPGPVLIAARVAAEIYGPTLRVLRG